MSLTYDTAGRDALNKFSLQKQEVNKKRYYRDKTTRKQQCSLIKRILIRQTRQIRIEVCQSDT